MLLKNFPVFVLIILYLFEHSGLVRGDANNSTVNVFDDEQHNITSLNYPGAYPFQNQTINVNAENGYFINLEVIYLNINTVQNGDKLTVLNSDGFQIEEIVNSTIDRNFEFSYNQITLHFLVFQENFDSDGFEIIFQRSKSPEITTIDHNITEAVTEINEEILVEDSITVHIAGRKAHEYDNITIMALKSVISDMAREFSIEKGLNLIEEITSDTVNITYLISCPINWADSEWCVRVIFAIPVYLVDDSSYQLNATYLNEMWDSLANIYLIRIGLTIYEEKNSLYYFTFWVLIFSLVFIIFAATLFITRHIIKTNLYKKSRNRSIGDMTTIWNDKSSMNEFPLGPHPLQDIPPFFQTQIRDFEPGRTSPIPSSMYSSDKGIHKQFDFENFEDNDDDSTIYDRKINTTYSQGSFA